MKNNRLVYIDNIRSLIIILVVIAHVSITYSGVGGWYYIENNYDEISSFQLAFFGFFIALTAAYSMGFLFLLVGYFAPGAYNRKGFFNFLFSRIVRLGTPVLLFVFLINPFDLYVLLHDNNRSFIDNYQSYIFNIDFIYYLGPLWFAFISLLFSILYAFFRLIIRKSWYDSLFNKISPNLGIIILIVLTSIFSFCIRLYYPIGSEFYDLQFSFFAQYIVLFIFGILTYRLNLLSKLTYRFGMKWFKYGFTFSLIMFACITYFGDVMNGNQEALFGGYYWQSAAYALWESITCASIILGLLVIFKEKFNRHNKFSLFLSKNSFGVYVLHTPIVIYISLLFIDFNLNPIYKTLIVSSITCPLSFIFSYIIKKFKLFNYIFS